MTNLSLPNPIEELAQRLRSLDRTLARELKNHLPFWWDNELSNSQGAIQQALISIARFTGLDIHSVLNPGEPLRFKNSNCRYKHASDKEQTDLAAATALVQSLANTVAETTLNGYTPFQPAAMLRQELLAAGNAWVDFKSLVDYCWAHGVPVMYLPQLPVAKKMDAVVVDVTGRPVIGLTKKHKHESELLFLLAHEMGHIFHRHLEQGQTLIDSDINANDDRDNQEQQANAFALELLTGSAGRQFHSNGKRLNAEQLASSARNIGQKQHIDPGHIALNWAHTTNHWPIAKSALNILYPNPDWQAYIKSQLLAHIDADLSREDSLAYLYQLMDIED